MYLNMQLRTKLKDKFETKNRNIKLILTNHKNWSSLILERNYKTTKIFLKKLTAIERGKKHYGEQMNLFKIPYPKPH